MNAALNFTKDTFWYCSCDKFQGCECRNGYRGHCYISRVINAYCENDFEKVKKDPIKLRELAYAFFLKM